MFATDFCFIADLAILQFGKSTTNKFVLDFKYPLSPIQAFGIALSSVWYQDGSKQSSGTGSSSGQKYALSGGSSSSSTSALNKQFLEPRKVG